MITTNTFASRISALSNRDLSDAEFYDELAATMAYACRADQHWLLLVDEQGVEVLSENDGDLRRFHGLSASDQDFDETLDWAIEDREVRVLTLASPGDGLPTNRLEMDSDARGDIFFVPVASPFKANILVCLHCHTLMPA